MSSTRILGLDVGTKRIGVARADTNVRIAIPVNTLKVDGTEFKEIARLINLYNIEQIVVGLPRSNEGNETEQSKYARNFASKLFKEFKNVKIFFQDESLTSVVAEDRLKSKNKSFEKGEIDTEAATIILQDYMESTVKIPYEEKENKMSKKSKKKLKIINLVAIFIIVALFVTGGLLFIKDIRAKQRAAEYARLEALMQADVFSFTVLPGETIFDIQNKLKDLGYQESEISAAFNKQYNSRALRNKPASATLEGYIFGETYEFYQGETVENIIETFLKTTEKIINDNNLEEKFEKQGLSLHEGIILASIVQKEANSEDQPTVAQVFYSRLNYGMLLGSDVTVSYAINVEDPNRNRYSDNASALQIDSCYNTRKYSGLPCGPISNPGISALLAVANPSDTSYLYFLTGDDGIMYYSYTENEHIQNIYSHCKKLCNVSL